MKYVGYVYKCTCLSNNKSYIGITTKDIQARRKEHIYASFNENDSTYKTHFHAALRKHGVENFQWDILEQIVGTDLDTVIKTLKSLEIKYVAFYDTFKTGYNMTPGGELTFRGAPKSVNMFNEDGIFIESGTIGYLASKYNLDDSAICKVCNRKYKFTGRLDGKRLVFRFLDDSYTEEDKYNLKVSKKGNKSGKQIVGYSLETGQELFRFKSVKEAAESLNLNHKSIANCAAGRHKYSGKIDNIKISWKYLE